MNAAAKDVSGALIASGLLLCLLVVALFGGADFVRYASKLLLVCVAVVLLGVLAGCIFCTLDMDAEFDEGEGE